MVTLPVFKSPDEPKQSGGCGSSCGAGLEKIYPSTAVRYGAMRWIGEFSYRPGTVFSCGAKVVIQSDRGMELGEQVSLTCHGCDKSVSREQIKRYIDNSGAEFYRLGSGRILREATPQDVDEQRHLDLTLHEDLDRCAMLAMQIGLDMKIVTVEHLLGGERIVFYFRSEDRLDFRPLVKELATYYRTRIEMRQVGARDEARLVADYEVCGRECCCKNFLKKLRPVNMKMAKLQKSTLDPSKVSGRCGRLRCCLRYEHESYEEMTAKLPRIGSRVGGAFGEATVIDRQILTQLVMLRTDDQRDLAMPVEEIKEFDLPQPQGAPVVPGENGNGDPVRPRRFERRGPQREEPQPQRDSAVTRDEPRPDPSENKDHSPSESAAPPPSGSEIAPPDGQGPPRRRDRRRRRRGRRNNPGGPPGPPPPDGNA